MGESKRGGKREGAGVKTGETGREQRLTEHRKTSYPKGQHIMPKQMIGNTEHFDPKKPLERGKPFMHLPNTTKHVRRDLYSLHDHFAQKYLHLDGESLTADKTYAYTGTLEQIAKLKALKPHLNDFTLVHRISAQTRGPGSE